MVEQVGPAPVTPLPWAPVAREATNLAASGKYDPVALIHMVTAAFQHTPPVVVVTATDGD